MGASQPFKLPDDYNLSNVYMDLEYFTLAALSKNDPDPLERYLLTLEQHQMIHVATLDLFAGVIIRLLMGPETPAERIEYLLDVWSDRAISQPGEEIFPAAAAITSGQIAIIRPDWWQVEISNLYKAAGHSQARVREMAVVAIQRLLQADRNRIEAVLEKWHTDSNPQVVQTIAEALT